MIIGDESMKKRLLLSILLLTLLFPFSVFAKEKVNIYFFHGDGCPHCEELKTYFNSLDNSYKEKINIQEYEVWNDYENAELMENISILRDDDATGVPYFIIGDKSWIGYSSSMDKEIEEQINKVYEEEANVRYDVMDLYEKEKDNIEAIKKEKENDEDDYDSWDFDDSYDDTYDDIEEKAKQALRVTLIAIAGAIIGFNILISAIILIVFLSKKKK